MRVSDLDIICVPEVGGASLDHWLTRWRLKLSTARHVEGADANAITRALTAAARESGQPKLLIGHSTGVIAIAHVAAELAGADVRGAFLVAPPDEETLKSLPGEWLAPPRAALPWPSIMVASRTDPWASFAFSQVLARDWQSALVDAGEAGRIDPEAGYGPWPDGLLKLAAFLRPL